MTARASPVVLRDVAAALDELADAAERTGAEGTLWSARVELLFAALLELAEFRAGNMDPRRRESIVLGYRMNRALRAGSTVGEIAGDFGCTRVTVWRRLRDVASHLATSRVFTPSRTDRKTKQESSV